MISLVAATLLVCAPGHPGTSAEAQPTMDALAKALGAGWTAVYEEKEAGCLRRLQDRDTVVALASLPFLLAHEKKEKLAPRLFAVPKGGEPLERWTLMTGKDARRPLEGYAVQSIAGFSPLFVRAMASTLPPDAKIIEGGAVLSALRRAANGEKIAVLLDGEQSAAVKQLPFADSLTAVDSSPPVPVAVVATVGKRLAPAKWNELGERLRHFGDDPAARDVLEGIRTSRFAPVDQGALSAARAAYERAR